MKRILLRIVRMPRRWIALFKQDVGQQVDNFTRQLEIKASSPPQTAVEDGGHDKFIIRVGAIGCSAFGLNQCSFGSA
jgi:hypothetical protein